MVVLVTWGASLVLWWLLTEIGYDMGSALYLVSVLVVVTMYGGRLLIELGAPLGTGLLTSVSILMAVLAWRVSSGILADAILVGLVIALGSAPIITLQKSLRDWGEDSVIAGPQMDLTLDARPDIFLIVLDGYPGLQAHVLDEIPLDGELRRRFDDAGFQMPSSAWSSYWETDKSVPSILDMSYPVTRPVTGDASKKRLYQLIGGDNRLVNILDQNGYETVMVESGWSGSNCTYYDRCISSPFLDEAMFMLVRLTLAGPAVLQNQGYSFTVGSQQTMGWLLDNASAISRSTTPEFVFAHLMAPHPPFFLDEDCQTVVNRARTGTQFYLEGVSQSDRETYFREQRKCVDHFMTRLIELIEPDDIMVLVADHGTDRRSQTLVPASDWSHHAMIERMNVFLAVHTGNGCVLPETVINPNLMRIVLSCNATEPVELLPDRMWINGMVELDRHDVQSLLGSDATVEASKGTNS